MKEKKDNTKIWPLLIVVLIIVLAYVSYTHFVVKKPSSDSKLIGKYQYENIDDTANVETLTLKANGVSIDEWTNTVESDGNGSMTGFWEETENGFIIKYDGAEQKFILQEDGRYLIEGTRNLDSYGNVINDGMYYRKID